VTIKGLAFRISAACTKPFQAPPSAILSALEQAQMQQVLRHLPMLYAVALLNILIVIAVCAHQGMAISHYGWMAAVVVVAVVRMIQWQRRSRSSELPAHPARFLRGVNWMAIGMIGCLSLWTSYAFSTGLFVDATFSPISLAFGATCIAHCLASSRFTAIGVLIVGILPSAFVMTFSGDFNAGMLGISMISITALMVRFIAEQYDQLIKRLMLEKQIRDQANSDPLTGLANRRAIMAALEEEEEATLNGGAPFGVALLDLDGFKGVNDTFGHPVGDALLQEVAVRLQKSVGQIDKVGRLGGDEFIILFRAVTGENDISGRSTAILAGLCGPVDFGVATVNIAASLGFARFAVDGNSVEALLSCADQALYAAKRANKAGQSQTTESTTLAA
jgi:diguanylate cyclase (GGDEF)-like protein